MSKKVLILSGSPRKGGNSDILCDEFLRGAQDAGHKAEKIRVAEKKVAPCSGCYYCNIHGGACVHKDNMADILQKMIDADVIVLASPVYFYAISAQLKAVIDRTVARWLEVKDKEFYYITTMADEEKASADTTLACFRGYADCVEGAMEKGTLIASGVYEPGAVRSTPAMAQAYEMGEERVMAVKQTAGRDALGEFAPKFAELNDEVLFGQVWNREDKLSLRDRSIVTVVALMAQGLTDSSFRYHLTAAKNNGITRTEIAEILTHAAFYVGWPKAWAAFRMAKEVWAEDAAEDARAQHQSEMVFPIGAPNDGFAQYFSRKSYLAPLSTAQVGIYNVTFEPGCRNNWHIHHAAKGGGQILVCVAGRGYYQEWDKAPQELHPGDVVNIPPEVKHWHGAAPDSWFSHLAVEVPGEGISNEWCEPMPEEIYKELR